MELRQVDYKDESGVPSTLQTVQLPAAEAWQTTQLKLKPSQDSQIIIALTRGKGSNGIAAVGVISGRFIYAEHLGAKYATARLKSPEIPTDVRNEFCVSLWHAALPRTKGFISLNDTVWSNPLLRDHSRTIHHWAHDLVQMKLPEDVDRFTIDAHMISGLIALDDLVLTPGQCPMPNKCTFEIFSPCRFNTEFTSPRLWYIGRSRVLNIPDHTMQDSTGHFLYVNTTVVDPAHPEARVFLEHRGPSPATCVTFWWKGIGKPSDLNLVFEAVSFPYFSGQSGVMVDDVEFTDGECPPESHYLLFRGTGNVIDSAVLELRERRFQCASFWYFISESSSGCRIEVGDNVLRNATQGWKHYTSDLSLSWVLQYGVTIRAYSGTDDTAFVAIDDIRVDERRCTEHDTVITDDFVCSITTEETVPMDKVCNFVKDCSNGVDEADCGSCDFRSTPCGWDLGRLRDKGLPSWQRRQVGEIPGSPKLNHDDTTNGFYMIFAGEEESKHVVERAIASAPIIRNTDYLCLFTFWYNYASRFLIFRSSETAVKSEIAGPILQANDTCAITFFYTIYNGASSRLILGVRHTIGGPLTEIWSTGKLDTSFDFLGHFEYLREERPFQVFFKGEHRATDEASYIAIDDVSFTSGCRPYHGTLPIEPPTPAPTDTPTCPQGQFVCVTSRQCIPQSQVCDFKQHCPDGSDERDCGSLISTGACDFSTDLCGLRTDNPDAKYTWNRISAKDVSKKPAGNYGLPKTDSTNDPDGFYCAFRHTNRGPYMYITNHGAEEGRGHLVSKRLGASGPAGRCFSFWYNMRHPNSGRLSLLARSEDNSTELLWTRSGPQGRAWLRGYADAHSDSYSHFVLEAVLPGSTPAVIAVDHIDVRGGECKSKGKYARLAKSYGRLVSPEVRVPPSAGRCVKFWYYLSGGDGEQLNVSRVTDFQREEPIWSVLASQGPPMTWLSGSVNLLGHQGPLAR
ncbi:apical endosomal glycoprotein precursor, putative [Ixodes scapularis]|uniref:Apical endosomal glycoprotein, putative n=1 Tax=Ixodes scapularis TaxID=6945 RepID=B7PWF1_IXOSC|nr:apical endosomal glycoprotein precursor, putative [Ixodes scapularis]|eukprot:XP_002409744.1 apical endosomal glycoprotein precursor, putative [Ixodes scapularis]